MEKPLSIEESNKLIAEFMDNWFEKTNRDDTFIEIGNAVPNSEDRETFLYWLDDLEFHTSWDWLMPVVEKIENLKLGDIDPFNDGDIHLDCEPCVEISNKYCNIFLQATMRVVDNFFDRGGNSKIEATYIAVTEFIIWYNNQQKQ